MKAGIVIIGRNEGERLRQCLASLRSVESSKLKVRSADSLSTLTFPLARAVDDSLSTLDFPLAPAVIYVDSGSTDGSVELARNRGAEVVELDMARPFSAARARNAGLARLLEMAPETRYVQFVDGDCTLADGWLQAAEQFLKQNPTYAAVVGRLRERYPERSIYNRLCDLEWNTPVGDVAACGGIAMYRVEAFTAAGGFDETVIAGEEPELCLRLRQKGWKIRRLSVEMGLHDADMTGFGQWWKRAVRGGYGGADVARRFEHGKGSFSRQLRSAWIWGIGWPSAVLVATAIAGAVGGWFAAAGATMAMIALLPAQVLRVAIRNRDRCGDFRTAMSYGALMVLGKWAHLQGQLRYWRDRRAGRHLSLIEYKTAAHTMPVPQ